MFETIKLRTVALFESMKTWTFGQKMTVTVWAILVPLLIISYNDTYQGGTETAAIIVVSVVAFIIFKVWAKGK